MYTNLISAPFFSLALCALLASQARADALSDLASDKLPFSSVGLVVRAHGGWSGESKNGTIRFALPDSRGFVWTGSALRSRGATESSPALFIELHALDSGAASGAAFPKLVDESSLFFDSPTPAQFASMAQCHNGSLESQVAASVAGKGKRLLTLRSAYTPKPALLAWIGPKSTIPAKILASFSATKSLDALREDASRDPAASDILEKLKTQSERSHAGAAQNCPSLSFGSAWPETQGSDAQGFLGVRSWRRDDLFPTPDAPSTRHEFLASATDDQARSAEALSRAKLGPPQIARMGYESGTPEFTLEWSFADGAKSDLKYRRAPQDEQGSLIYSVEIISAREKNR